MRIAMFSDCYYPRINGVVISVQSYARELIKRGHTVCVVSVEYPEEYIYGNDHSDTIENPNFSVVRISSHPIIFSKEDRIARLEKWFFIKKKMDEFAPDVIHLNSEWLVGYFGAMYARHRKIPCMFTFHTMWEDYIHNYVPVLNSKISHKIGRDLVKFYLKSANHILAPTQRIANTVREYGINTEVELLPTGIPETLFEYDKIRLEKVKSDLYAKHPLLKGKKILMFAGRIAKEKNLDFLLPVLKRVKELISKEPAPVDPSDKGFGIALLIAGDGLYMPDFKELVEKEKLTDSVFYVGYVSRQTLAYMYTLADVFTFPSKTETQGLVTAEAMAAGLPVVAIGEMGTIDVMQGDHGGFMVPEDTELFARRVTDLLTDSELYSEKVVECKLWSKQWMINSLTDRLEQSYKTCITKYRKSNEKKLSGN